MEDRLTRNEKWSESRSERLEDLLVGQSPTERHSSVEAELAIEFELTQRGQLLTITRKRVGCDASGAEHEPIKNGQCHRSGRFAPRGGRPSDRTLPVWLKIH